MFKARRMRQFLRETYREASLQNTKIGRRGRGIDKYGYTSRLFQQLNRNYDLFPNNINADSR